MSNRKTICNVHSIQKYDVGFIVFIITCTLIILASVVISAFDLVSLSFEKHGFDVACQVMTTMVCCIASVIGISFSLQDSEFLGIKTKDLLAIRVERHFSHSQIIVVSIILVTLNLTAYLLNWIVASIGISFVAIAFCIYVICSEVPLMAKDETAGIKILKNRMRTETNSSDVLYTKFDEALKYIILEKNISTAYKLLSSDIEGESKYNEKVLVKLLDLQVDIAASLQNIESKAVLCETVNGLEENIIDLVRFKFDISEIVKEDLNQYTHYITHVLSLLPKTDCGKYSAPEIVNSMLFAIDTSLSSDQKVKKRDFLISIILTMVASSANNGDTSFLKSIKEHYSYYYYSLKDSTPSTLIFAEISMYLYYICEVETSVPKNITQKIRDQLKEDVSAHGYSCKSWDTLFKHITSSLNSFPVEFSEFLNCFTKNKHLLEYIPADGEAHWVVFDTRFAVKWYLTILLNSYSIFHFDYDTLFSPSKVSFQFDTSNLHYYIENFAEPCFDEDGVFSACEDMKKILSFYGYEDRHFQYFNIVEAENHEFFHFINRQKKGALAISAKESDTISDEKLAQKLKTGVESTIQSEWGYNNQIEISSTPKFLQILIEKSKDIVNIDDYYINEIVQSFFAELNKNLNVISVKLDEHLISSLKQYMDTKPTFCSLGLRERCNLFIHNFDDKERFMNWIKEANTFDSNILFYDTLIIGEPFSFNYVFDNFSIESLNADQLAYQTELHKRTDGQYTYNGVFMNREEIEDIISKKYKILSIQLRYQISSENNSIIKLDLFSNQLQNDSTALTNSTPK